VAISSVILAGVLLSGLVASRYALVSTRTSAEESNVETNSAKAADRILDMLASAGQSTLLAVPPKGQLPGPVVDGVVYDNLQFRQAVGFDATGVVYDPDPAVAPPLGFRLVPDPRTPGRGNVVVNVDGQDRVLVRNVAGFRLVKQGRSITLTLDYRIGLQGRTADSVRTRTVVLRNP